jgi:hypothetical protein
VAWVRTYASGRQAIYLRNLRDRRTKRSVRLDGAAPARTCVTISERCVPVRHLGFDALQLTDRWLAAVSQFGSSSPVGISQSELRLVDVLNGGRSPRVAFQVTGLGGQALVGPSFARGRLGWALSCTGEPDGCTTRKAGYWRYSIGAGYEHAAARPRLFGFSLQDDGGAIELRRGARDRLPVLPARPARPRLRAGAHRAARLRAGAGAGLVVPTATFAGSAAMPCRHEMLDSARLAGSAVSAGAGGDSLSGR